MLILTSAHGDVSIPVHCDDPLLLIGGINNKIGAYKLYLCHLCTSKNTPKLRSYLKEKLASLKHFSK